MMLTWLQENNAHLNQVFNIIMSFVMLILSGFVLNTLSKPRKIEMSKSLRLILWGVMVEALGWSMNRAYWALAWYGDEHGWNVIKADSSLSWISLVPLFISLCGLIMMFTGIFTQKGNYLWVASVFSGFCFSLLWLVSHII